MKQDPIRVAIVAFDKISPLHLWMPMTIFGSTYETGSHYQTMVCAERKGEIRTADGFAFSIPEDLDCIAGLGKGDLVIVPSWRNVETPTSEGLLDGLRRAHQSGATVVGLCLGAFVLAEAGLLNKRSATTHWAWADTFAQRFPQVDLKADALYVDEGSVVTSAGVAAAMDCCLHIMRQQIGATAANRTARNLVVSPHREGGQAQFIERPIATKAGESKLDMVMEWVRDHLKESHSIDTLAKKANMSRRSFTRKFQMTTGTSFTQWLLLERLGFSQHLLESSDLSIDAIAFESGFGSPVTLRHHFKRRFGVTPTAWRKTFRSQA